MQAASSCTFKGYSIIDINILWIGDSSYQVGLFQFNYCGSFLYLFCEAQQDLVNYDHTCSLLGLVDDEDRKHNFDNYLQYL